MTKETHASEEKKGKSARKARTTVTNDEGTLGRATLMEFKTAALYKLLRQKKIPGRSKITTKAARARTLDGMVTPADVAEAGLTLPTPRAPAPPAGPAPGAPPARPGLGCRLEVPVVGIDVHKDTLWLAAATPDGIAGVTCVPNTNAGIRDAIRYCVKHGARHVGLESTAEYWLKAHWAFRDAGFEVLVANALQTKQTQGVKTDPRDAKRIALALRDGRLKPSVLCSRDQYRRRKLSRAATKKAELAGAAVNRLKGFLHAHDAAPWILKLHDSARGRRILQGVLGGIHEVGEVRTLLEHEYGQGSHQITDAEKLQGRAGDLAAFAGSLAAAPRERLQLAHHLEEIVTFRRMATELRTRLLADAASDPGFLRALELCLTLPGVGPGTALPMVVEIADVHAFRNPEALAKWAGVTPRVHQSGHHKRRTGHITKAGNKHLRRAAFLAAQADYRFAGDGPGHPVGRFVRHLYKDRDKPYKVAVTAGARKLLTYLHRVLAEGRPFQEVLAGEESRRLAETRRRKLKKLRRAVARAATADLLPAVIDALTGRLERLDEVERRYADQLAQLLEGATAEATT
jgi:transposase